jgi:hypothetical protein
MLTLQGTTPTPEPSVQDISANAAASGIAIAAIVVFMVVLVIVIARIVSTRRANVRPARDPEKPFAS